MSVPHDPLVEAVRGRPSGPIHEKHPVQMSLVFRPGGFPVPGIIDAAHVRVVLDKFRQENAVRV